MQPAFVSVNIGFLLVLKNFYDEKNWERNIWEILNSLRNSWTYPSLAHLKRSEFNFTFCTEQIFYAIKDSSGIKKRLNLKYVNICDTSKHNLMTGNNSRLMFQRLSWRRSIQYLTAQTGQLVKSVCNLSKASSILKKYNHLHT